MILGEYVVEGCGDIYPFGILRQQRCYNLMVALATREHFSVPYHLQYFGREERLWVICDAYNNEPYHNSKLLSILLPLLQVSAWFKLCRIIEGEDGIT